MAEAAAQWQVVDRSTIMRIRTVAKEGALAALAASRPGVKSRERDYELEAVKAENARLAEAVKEMAVIPKERDRSRGFFGRDDALRTCQGRAAAAPGSKMPARRRAEDERS